MTNPTDPGQPVITTEAEAREAFGNWFSAASGEDTGGVVEQQLDRIRARQAQARGRQS
jgi:hypothetical protein